LIGDVASRRGLFSPDELLNQMMGDAQGKQCAEAVAGRKRVRFELIRFHVLVGEGQFRPVKHDQPAQLEPGEEKGQGGKTSVDGIVLDDADLESDVNPFDHLKDCAGDDSRDEADGKSHLGVRHENVEKGKKPPHEGVREQLQKKKDHGGKASQNGEFLKNQIHLRGNENVHAT